jgi:thiol-disulfide isomerase/thioredoxin
LISFDKIFYSLKTNFMKKLLLSIFTIAALSVSAQTSLTTAVDFTAKDIDGNTFNLFNKLDEGKYVFLDFMFTNCGPCQNAAPKLHEAFMTYGANSPFSQIYFVTINRDDNNAVLHTWETTYMSPTGPSYPLGISGTEGSATGGPQTFHNLYGINAFPTMILIAPNRNILEQDIWPISTAADFAPFFTPHGINPNPAGINNVVINNNVSIYPSPAAEQITLNVTGNKLNGVRILDVLGNAVFTQNFDNTQQIKSLDISNLANGVYFAEVRINNTELVVKKFVKE